jgi:hypothetical protein
MINVYSCYSYRKREIERLLSLTDSFTWEELPTRDPKTGRLTKAGYLPVIQKITKYSSAIMFGFHFGQSAVRIVVNHDMIVTSWFPFDASASPLFELMNVMQVMLEIFNVLSIILFQVFRTEKRLSILKSECLRNLEGAVNSSLYFERRCVQIHPSGSYIYFDCCQNWCRYLPYLRAMCKMSRKL